MALRYFGKDDKSGDHGSPTVWLDEDTNDLVLQGWRLDKDTEAQCLKDGPIPDHETVVRVPERMFSKIRKALYENLSPNFEIWSEGYDEAADAVVKLLGEIGGDALALFHVVSFRR